MAKHIDRNVEVGDTIIDNDPRTMARYGKVLEVMDFEHGPEVVRKMRVVWADGPRRWCRVDRIRPGTRAGYTLVKKPVEQGE